VDGAPAPAVPAGTDPEDDVIGRREHPRIIASYGGVYSHRQAEIMLARIVGRLLAAAEQPNAQFTVTILDSAEVNAFALPGGYVYVTRGILALSNDMSELAAVLAHEISHVTLRHARARSDRVRTSAIVDRVITGVLGGNVETDQSANRARASLAAFSQAQELEADQEGVRIAGRAGYDPHAAARFLGAMGRFASFEGEDNGDGDGFLSSHPSTPNRIQQAVAAARQFGAPGIGESGREAYMQAIDGIVFGDSPQQGAIVGQRFIHPQLRFMFTVPDGYSLQNSRSAVVAVANDGEAVRFDSAEVPASLSLVDYLKTGWIAGLDTDSVRPAQVNGIDAATGFAHTDQWVFRVSVLRIDGQVYRFIFAASSDTERFQRAAEDTTASFRRTTPADLSAIRSTAIQTVTASADDTIETLVGRMGSVTRARDLFLVLNNLFAGDELTTGARYKIIAVN
jgi:predicted Zn-dependent protease